MFPLPPPSRPPTPEAEQLPILLRTHQEHPISGIDTIGMTPAEYFCSGINSMGPATAEALARSFEHATSQDSPTAPSVSAATVVPEVNRRALTWAEKVERQYKTYRCVNPGTAVTLEDFHRASRLGRTGAPSEAFRAQNLLTLYLEESGVSSEEDHQDVVLGRERAFSSVLTAERPPPYPAEAESRLNRLLQIAEIVCPLRPGYPVYGLSGQNLRPSWNSGKRFRRTEAIQMDLHRHGFTVDSPSSKLRRTLRREAIFGKPNRDCHGKPLPQGENQ